MHPIFLLTTFRFVFLILFVFILGSLYFQPVGRSFNSGLVWKSCYLHLTKRINFLSKKRRKQTFSNDVFTVHSELKSLLSYKSIPIRNHFLNCLCLCFIRNFNVVILDKINRRLKPILQFRATPDWKRTLYIW